MVMGLSSCLSTLLNATRKRKAHKPKSSSVFDVTEDGESKSETKRETSKRSNTDKDEGDAETDEKDSHTGSISSSSTKICAVTVNKLQMLYLETGAVTLIAQGRLFFPGHVLFERCSNLVVVGGDDESVTYLMQVLRAVEEVLLYYLGKFLHDTSHLAAVKGVLVRLLIRRIDCEINTARCSTGFC